MTSPLTRTGVSPRTPPTNTAARDIWKLRELIPVAIEEEGRVHKYDVSVPLSAFYDIVAETRQRCVRVRLCWAAVTHTARTHKRRPCTPPCPAPLPSCCRLAYRPSVQVVGYGHLGDSNLHLNIAVPRHEADPSEAIEAVLPWVMAHKGSVSAEHGLGVLKARYLRKTKSPQVYGLMRDVKALLDPNGILNPYKYYGE